MTVGENEHEPIYAMIRDLAASQKEGLAQVTKAIEESERRVMASIQTLHDDVRNVEGGYAELRERFGRLDERNDNSMKKIEDMQKDIDRSHAKAREATDKAQVVREENIRINLIIALILAVAMVGFVAYVNYNANRPTATRAQVQQ